VELKSKGEQLLDTLLQGIEKDSVQTSSIVVAVDMSSGGVDLNKVNNVLTEITEGIRAYGNPSDVVLLYTDYDIHEYNITVLDRPLEQFVLMGGGGTSFVPAIRWAEESLENCLGLIYITDGYGAYPEKAPDFRVLWALTSEFDVPFGAKVLI
jgi:predicted metal-dependent peptidase